MDSSKNFKKFQELEKQAKEFVTRNNINAFNLGVNEGIEFSVTLIEKLLKDFDNDNKDILIVVKGIKDLKAKLLERIEY
jgi:hypothetical protein